MEGSVAGGLLTGGPRPRQSRPNVAGAGLELGAAGQMSRQFAGRGKGRETGIRQVVPCDPGDVAEKK